MIYLTHWEINCFSSSLALAWQIAIGRTRRITSSHHCGCASHPRPTRRIRIKNRFPLESKAESGAGGSRSDAGNKQGDFLFFSFFFCKIFSDFLPSFPSTSSWLCLCRQHFSMFYTTTSSRACFRNKTINKSSTNPTDSQFFSALLHWSRGERRKRVKLSVTEQTQKKSSAVIIYSFMNEMSLHSCSTVKPLSRLLHWLSRDPQVNPLLFVLKARKSWLVQKFLISYFFPSFFSFHSSAHILSTTTQPTARSFLKTFCRLTLLHIFS